MSSALTWLVLALAIVAVADLNRRRIAAERRGRAEAETLADIGRRISASLDLDEVLRTAAESAHRLASTDVTAIALIDSQRRLPVATAVGNRTSLLTALVIPADSGSAARVMATGHPYLKHWDGAEDGLTRSPAALEAMSAEGIRSTLAVPILDGSGTVGVFWMHSRVHRTYTESEIAFLERLAAQAGAAIANARAHAEVEALLATTAKLGEQAEPEEVLRTLVEEAARLLEAERAVYAIRRDGRLFVPAEFRAGIWAPDGHDARPDGILWSVWESGHPYRADDVGADPRANPESVRAHGSRSQLTVPLQSTNGGNLGLISVNNKRGFEGFSARDQRLLTAICETGAAILTRANEAAARLAAERAAGHRKREVAALLSAADQLSSTIEPEEVLLRVVSATADLLAVKRAGIATNEGDHALRRYTWVEGVWHPDQTRLRLDGSVAGWVIQHRRPYRDTDLPYGPQTFSPASTNGLPTSVLAVPVFGRDGRVLGSLQLFERRDGRPFSEEDERLAEGIAHHAAAALERARLLEALRREEARFRSLVQQASDIIVVWSALGRVTYVSPAVERILGHLPIELMGADPLAYVHPDDRNRAERGLAERATQRGETGPSSVYRIRHCDGSWRHLEVRVTNLLDEPGVDGFVANMHDITERIQLEDRLWTQAFSDSLTGMPNRPLFMDRLTQALASAGRQTGRVAVLFLDLDGFKFVNDSLGHAAGDDLLIAVARRLIAGQRAGTIVARLGGDEFAVLLDDLTQPSNALKIAERIAEEFRHPFALRGRDLVVAASIGVALNDGEAEHGEAEDLLRQADIALYQAKSKGKGQISVFAPCMNIVPADRLELETDLHGAVERRELRLYYQPIVELASGSVIGTEALLRWRHPRRRFVEAANFVPILEETGLIVPAGQWVLEEACKQAHRWLEIRPNTTKLLMSVNISARQLEQPDFVDQVARALQDTGLCPESLELELTESTLIQHWDVALSTLARLRVLGVRLAVDDFGTGYSSLDYVERLAPNRLKIDQSFVRKLTTDRSSIAIVQAVMTLSRALGIDVTAEGIENAKQLALLRDLGCLFGQGFYFAEPLPRLRTEMLLESGCALPMR